VYLLQGCSGVGKQQVIFQVDAVVGDARFGDGFENLRPDSGVISLVLLDALALDAENSPNSLHGLISEINALLRFVSGEQPLYSSAFDSAAPTNSSLSRLVEASKTSCFSSPTSSTRTVIVSLPRYSPLSICSDRGSST